MEEGVGFVYRSHLHQVDLAGRSPGLTFDFLRK